MRPADAYFQDWGLSARGAGWGGAGSAWGTGALDGLMVNPAAMGRVRTLRVDADFARWGYGWNDGSALTEGGLRWAMPLDQGTWALAWQTRGLPDFFMEEGFLAALAWPTGWEGIEFLGIGVTSSHVGFQNGWAVRNNTGIAALDARAASWSFGLRGWLASGLTYALGASELNQPSLSVTGEEVALPATLRLGLGWEVISGWRIAVDPEWRGLGGIVRSGVEYAAPDESFSVRTGTVASWSSGRSLQFASWHAGGSYRVDLGWGDLRLHYGWSVPLSGIGGWGRHQFGVSVQDRGSSVPAVNEATASAFVQESFFPDPPWFYATLQLPDREWASIGEGNVPPRDRHRKAVLTTILVGTTAGEAEYQTLVEAEPSSYEGAALRMIRELRYGEEADLLHRMVRAYRAAVELPEAPPEIWMTLGYLLAQQGAWKDSLEAYRRWGSLTKGERSEPGGWYTMAVVALKVPDLTAAESALARLGEGGESGPWMKELQGRIFLGRGRVEEAIAAFQAMERPEALPEERGRAKWLQAVAISRLSQEGAMDQALAKLEEAEGFFPDPLPVKAARRRMIDDAVTRWLEEGRLLEERLLIKEALQAYRRVLKLVPEQAQALARAARVEERIQEQVQSHALRAREALSARDLEQALREWRLVLDADAAHQEASEQISAIIPALLAKAEDRLKEGLYQDVVGIYGLVDQVRPRDPAVQSGRARLKKVFVERVASHESQEEIAKARQVWEEYQRFQPDDPEIPGEIRRLADEGQKRSAAYLFQAKSLERKGDVVEALFMVQKALRVDPASEEAVGLARQMTQQKESSLKKWREGATKALREERDGDAVVLIRNILRVDPDHREAKQWLAEVEGRQSKRTAGLFRSAGEAETRLEPEEALRLLSQLLTLVPDHAGGQELQRKIRERREKSAKHRAEVKEAELNGDIAFGQGRMAEALTAYEKAVEWDYYNKELRRKMEDARQQAKPR